MRYFLAFLFPSLLLFSYFSSFTLTHAQIPGELIVCGGEDPDKPGGKCDFEKLLELFNKVLQYAIKYIIVPIAVLAILLAGYLMVRHGDSAAGKGRAKAIFQNVALGFLFIFGAFVIVKSLLDLVLGDSSSADAIRSIF